LLLGLAEADGRLVVAPADAALLLDGAVRGLVLGRRGDAGVELPALHPQVRRGAVLVLGLPDGGLGRVRHLDAAALAGLEVAAGPARLLGADLVLALADRLLVALRDARAVAARPLGRGVLPLVDGGGPGVGRRLRRRARPRRRDGGAVLP